MPFLGNPVHQSVTNVQPERMQKCIYQRTEQRAQCPADFKVFFHRWTNQEKEKPQW
jgi:hypothetical protein